jgi:hypothetical protein
MPAVKLQGKWTEVAIVENYGETDEAETLLDLTTGDIVIGGDENTIEADSHTDPITDRRVIGGAPFIEITSFEGEAESILEQVGIIDSSGEWQVSDRSLEAVRVKNHNQHPSDSSGPVRVYDGVSVEAEWSEDATFPEDDFVESGVTFHVNERLERNSSEEA